MMIYGKVVFCLALLLAFSSARGAHLALSVDGGSKRDRPLCATTARDLGVVFFGSEELRKTLFQVAGVFSSFSNWLMLCWH